MTTYKTIEQLPVNRTVVFKTLMQGAYKLVRTGTIGDGSCAFHAILHAYSPEYVSKSESSRKQIAAKLRKKIADSISRSDWISAQDGSVAIISFQKYFSDNIDKVVEIIENNNTETDDAFVEKCGLNDTKNTHILKLVFDIISPRNLIDEKVLPQMSNYANLDLCKDGIIDTLCRTLEENETVQQISSTRQRFLRNQLSKLIDRVTQISEEQAYEEYIQNIRSSDTFVDTTMFDMLGDWFGRNIFVIDDKTRLPYMFSSKVNERPSIILLWVNENHYEVIGKMLEDSKVQREFNINDVLIKKINSYLYNPQQLAVEFPELYPYVTTRVEA